MILIFYHRRPLYCLIYRDFFTGSNEHFKFTALTEKLKGKSLFADELIGHVFILIFNLVVGIYGINWYSSLQLEDDFHACK